MVFVSCRMKVIEMRTKLPPGTCPVSQPWQFPLCSLSKCHQAQHSRHLLGQTMYWIFCHKTIFINLVEANKWINDEAPWVKELSSTWRVGARWLTWHHSPHYFKSCRISAIALTQIKTVSGSSGHLSIYWQLISGYPCMLRSPSWDHGHHAGQSDGKLNSHHGFIRPPHPRHRCMLMPPTRQTSTWWNMFRAARRWVGVFE